MTLNVTSMFLGSAAVLCAVLSGIVTMQEIGEINRKLPDDQQISYWGMYSEKYSRVKQAYKQLYPKGRLHGLGVGLEIAAFVFFALALLAAGFFRTR